MDPRYLCYLLNESDAIKKQMAVSMQGSTVRKLTPAILKALDVDLPSMETQRKIGKAYLTIKKRTALARQQTELEQVLYLAVVKQYDFLTLSIQFSNFTHQIFRREFLEFWKLTGSRATELYYLSQPFNLLCR